MPAPTAEYFDHARATEHALRHLLPSLADMGDRLPRMVRDMSERLGFSAVLVLVEKLGGTTIPVPMRATPAGEARYRKIAAILGEDLADALCRAYPATDLYIPNCRAALIEARDAALTRDRDILAREDYSERDIVATLSLRYGLSDRHVWRILKKPVRRPEGPTQTALL